MKIVRSTLLLAVACFATFSSASAALRGATDPSLAAVLKSYPGANGGGLFGLQAPGVGAGSCPAGGKCQGFYTWQDFSAAVFQWNKANPSQRFLGEASVADNARTLAAYFANIGHETAGYTACKERLQLADRSCPAAPNTGGCSGGFVGSYTSAQSAAQGFSVTTCNGLAAPTAGCTDFWGNQLADAKDCWFGRGALQLTWPGNYATHAASVKAAGGGDICANPDAVCDSPLTAFVSSLSFWTGKDAAWRRTHAINDAIAIPNPQDKSSNPARVVDYGRYLAAMGVEAAPAPAPLPSSGSFTVEAGDGCWAIADRVCPGKGNDFETVLRGVDCKAPWVGARGTYDCDGSAPAPPAPAGPSTPSGVPASCPLCSGGCWCAGGQCGAVGCSLAANCDVATRPGWLTDGSAAWCGSA